MTGVDLTELPIGHDAEADRRRLQQWIADQWDAAHTAVATHRGTAAEFSIPFVPLAVPE